MSAAYWVFRRELHGMLRAPILYVIGGVFLVVQGVAFAGLVGALSDPRRPAPLGALLEGQLAGTLLTWVLELVVLTLLGMRAIAEDKRSGAWELLLTAQVGEGAAVVGKWLAAVCVYALLWVPTLAYLAVVALTRADDGGWDLGAIAVGYVGAIAIGAALLAWVIAASAAMASTLGAGALGFAFAIGLFLVDELPELWPTLAIDHPRAAGVLEAVSLRAHAVRFARGEIDLGAVLFLGGLVVSGLSLAIALACAGRRQARELRLRVGGTIALALAATFTTALAVRHPARLDVSADRRNSLDPATRAVLGALPGPASFVIVRPTFGGLEPVYAEVARVAARMAEAAPALRVRAADPATVPGGFAAVARAAGIAEAELAPGGAVVVELVRGGAPRRRVVELDALATLQAGAGGEPVVARLAIEQALAGALAALASDRPVVACATTGHGELPLDREEPSGVDWTTIAARLRGDGMSVEAIALASGVPPACQVVIVAGPSTPLVAEEALAIQAHVQRGGGLLVAAASRSLVGGLGATGLEGVLAAEGLGLPPAIVVDPTITPRDLQGGLVVVDGYADHPINRGFANTRSTLWFQPRAVVTSAGATPLVRATAASWGETELAAPPAKSADDLGGPVALAASASNHRVIALGSAESFSRAVLALPASAGSDLWLARAIRHLAGVPEPAVDIAARAPDQIRLSLTDAQRSAIIALCVGGIPLAWLLAGGLLVWWRRRRA